MASIRRPVLASCLAFLVVATIAFLTSSASALDINTEVSLPDGEVGVPYEFQFTGKEGCQPYNFAFKAGTLPPGLTVERDGKLTGTPTTAGTFTFWVELTDGVPGGACHSAVASQGEFTVIVAPNIKITATLPEAKVGAPFNTTVTATGGGTLQWAVVEGALPPGLSLNRDTGALAGVPSTVGTYSFTVKVSDDKRKATQQYTIVVAAPLAVEPSVTLARSEVGVAVGASVPSTGGIGPLAWTLAGGALPPGLSLDAKTGSIQGTPRAAGAFAVHVKVTDSDGQTVQSEVRLAVAPRLAIVTSRLAGAWVGKSYRVRLATRGGVGARTWRVVGALPRGFVLSSATGLVSGVPRLRGTYRLTVKVTDALRATATRSFVLAVAPAA